MRKRLLLVTSSELTREVLVHALRDHRYEVVVVDDTWEAVGACAGRKMDLILVDLDWPGDSDWSGWELIKGAKVAEPSLPILLITGHRELATAARAAGVCGLAEKPVDVAALVKAVDGLVEERGNAENGSHVCRAGHFEHISAEGDAQRAAIPDRFQRAVWASEPYEHWGLSE
jgi:two-component system, NtrC family, nitrogen regulation response regulator NtrX